MSSPSFHEPSGCRRWTKYLPLSTSVFSARRCVPSRSHGDCYLPRVPFNRGTHADIGSARSRRLRRLVSTGACTAGRLVRAMPIPLREPGHRPGRVEASF